MMSAEGSSIPTESVPSGNAAEAEYLLTEQLPDPVEKAIVLWRLLESADAANAIAPDAWAVTLFPNGFRLNVGQVETVRFFDGTLYINLVGSPGIDGLIDASFAATSNYRSLPQPLCEFVGTIQQYADLAHVIRQAHEKFIALAATTSSGQPRKGTPFRSSHHEGLIEYARHLCSVQGEPAGESTPSMIAVDIDLMTSASEGNTRLVTHLRRERNRALIDAKKAAAMKAAGNLACEVCGFDFSIAYGSRGTEFCEVHHRTPLSASEGTVTTTLEDLAVLCSNCHRVIHLSPMLSVTALAEMVHRNSADADSPVRPGGRVHES